MRCVGVLHLKEGETQVLVGSPQLAKHYFVQLGFSTSN
jgi:hypothetical protein